jgi:hypothetical protein
MLRINSIKFGILFKYFVIIRKFFFIRIWTNAYKINDNKNPIFVGRLIIIFPNIKIIKFLKIQIMPKGKMPKTARLCLASNTSYTDHCFRVKYQVKKNKANNAMLFIKSEHCLLLPALILVFSIFSFTHGASQYHQPPSTPVRGIPLLHFSTTFVNSF